MIRYDEGIPFKVPTTFNMRLVLGLQLVINSFALLYSSELLQQLQMEKPGTETSQRRMVSSIKRSANEKFVQNSFETLRLTELFKNLRVKTRFPDTKLQN